MIKLRSLSQLRINVLSGLTTTGLNVVVMVISYPLYLHYLGYEKTGIWLLLSSVQTFAQLGLLGIGPALTKMVAEDRGRADYAGAQQYISLATSALAALSLLAVTMVVVFRKDIVWAMGIRGDDAIAAVRLLPWMGLLTAFGFLNQVPVAALAGISRMDLANYDVSAGKVIALLVEVVLLQKQCGLLSLLVGDFAGCTVIQIMGFVQLRRVGNLSLLKAFTWDTGRLAKLLNFGGRMFIASVASLMVSPLNKWALARYAGVALVPVYEIAFNGSMQLRGLVEVGLRALMPAISHRLASADPGAAADVRRLYKKTMTWLLLILPLGYGIALFSARTFFKLWLRHRFVPEIVPTFDIIFASAVVSLIAVPAFFLLMGSGRIHSCMVSHLVSAGANVVCIAVMIAWYGQVTIYGASCAVFVTMTASSVYLLRRASAMLSSAPEAPLHALEGSGVESGAGLVAG